MSVPITSTTPPTPTTPPSGSASGPGSTGVSGTPDSMSSLDPQPSVGRVQAWLITHQDAKCLGCIWRFLLKCCYRQPAPVPGPAPAPVPVPVVVPDNVKIISAFTVSTPSDDAVKVLVCDFAKLSLPDQLGVLETLQGSTNCTAATAKLFIDAMLDKETLYTHVFNAQPPANRVQGKDVIIADCKSPIARDGVTKYKKALLTERDTKGKEAVVHNFKDSYPSVEQRRLAMDTFKKLGPKSQLETVLMLMDAMAAPYATPLIVQEHVNALPDGLRVDLLGRIQGRVAIEQQLREVNINNAWQLLMLDSITNGTDEPAPLAPLPPPADGQTYIRTNTQSDLVKECLRDLIATL